MGKYNQIITGIIADIEAGAAGGGKMPWHRPGGGRPVNVFTGKKFTGINVVRLWIAAHNNGWGDQWATYKQWRRMGKRVRRGESGTAILCYSPAREIIDPDTGEADIVPPGTRLAYEFNRHQLADYCAEFDMPPDAGPGAGADAKADAFIAATGADIRHGGHRAFYRHDQDFIQIPEKNLFIYENPTESYYAILLHELTHWTGNAARLARPMSGDKKSREYAIEELIAEIGAAFLCADLHIGNAPRADHAAYLANWLAAIKEKPGLLLTAAAAAEKACQYLHALQADKAESAAA